MGKWRYEKGNFVEGYLHGKGTYINHVGRKYEGDFIDGNFDGNGTLTWPNGDKYIGEFKRNYRTGYGEFIRMMALF